MNNPHQCVIWPFEGPCRMKAQSKTHYHFHNTKCKIVFWLFVSSSITPSSPSLDKHSQRRFFIQTAKELETNYFNVTLITMTHIHLTKL